MKTQLSKTTHLEHLLEQYVQARIMDNNKGGGDPEDYEEIELFLQNARTDLREFLQILVKYARVKIEEQDFTKAESKEVRKLLADLKRFPGTL